MSTISQLFSAAGVSHGGVVPWGEPVQSTKSGVYVVALSPDPGYNAPLLDAAPLDSGAIEVWLAHATELGIDDDPNPTPDAVANRLRKYWLTDESTLYIGQTEGPLFCRIRDLYRHKLGRRSPHRGGHWIRTLSVLEDLYVHYAESSQPKSTECRLIEMFVARVSPRSKAQVGPDDYPFPFANLKLTKIKRHGIRRQAV